MTSLILNLFLHNILPYFTRRLIFTESRWCADIPELTEEVWQEILPLQVPTVISSRTKVIQTKFLYRSYYTSSLLFRSVPSAVCSRCSLADGTFYYMVWKCTPIRAFWSEGLKSLLLVTQLLKYLTFVTP